MSVRLYPYQQEALSKLGVGSILCGGTGSGKSITALAFYFSNICKGSIDPFSIMTEPLDLYIITTAKKRDTLDWEKEAANFLITKDSDKNVNGISFVVDSWNNIKKYTKVYGAFFIFDEQRVVGSGAWVKSFLKIANKNKWILLSATPGDTWMDYIPVFVANGFYKNRTEFISRHVIYNSFVNFPKVDRYVEEGRLIRLKNKILVKMKEPQRRRKINKTVLYLDYDKNTYDSVCKNRWNIFKDKPIKNASEYCYTLRQIVNSDKSRIDEVKKLIREHNRIIIFYNFNYELEILRQIGKDLEVVTKELNGERHDDVPDTDEWLYLVQYMAGSEAWECFTANTMIFYSQSYSYKHFKQAMGRIDRLTTTFDNLYYYIFTSNAWIDVCIRRCLDSKKDFNERDFVKI